MKIYPEKCYLSQFIDQDNSSAYYQSLATLDQLLERDKQREKDGFFKKVKFAKIIQPGGSQKVKIVPAVTEEKFYHNSEYASDTELRQLGIVKASENVGKSKEKVGTVIGRRPVTGGSQGDSKSAGNEHENHDIESNAYDLGRILTNKFKLPDLEDKGKKKSLTKFTYDLTDMNRGTGQIIDKKETLKQIIKTNIALKRFDIKACAPIKPLIIGGNDYVYKTLSRERDTEAQAMVFFLRDYSGSMYGRPTELVCTQHLLIYSWLVYQYQGQVENCFILHDTEAEEAKDFDTYYNTNVAGGTIIESAITLTNNLIQKGNLVKDYNIYVFYGGDGGDWNPNDELNAAIEKLIGYSNRVGFTIINGWGAATPLEDFFTNYSLTDKHPSKLKVDVMSDNADEDRLIEGIKNLVS